MTSRQLTLPSRCSCARRGSARWRPSHSAWQCWRSWQRRQVSREEIDRESGQTRTGCQTRISERCHCTAGPLPRSLNTPSLVLARVAVDAHRTADTMVAAAPVDGRDFFHHRGEVQPDSYYAHQTDPLSGKRMYAHRKSLTMMRAQITQHKAIAQVKELASKAKEAKLEAKATLQAAKAAKKDATTPAAMRAAIKAVKRAKLALKQATQKTKKAEKQAKQAVAAAKATQKGPRKRPPMFQKGVLNVNLPKQEQRVKAYESVRHRSTKSIARLLVHVHGKAPDRQTQHACQRLAQLQQAKVDARKRVTTMIRSLHACSAIQEKAKRKACVKDTATKLEAWKIPRVWQREIADPCQRARNVSGWRKRDCQWLRSTRHPSRH